MKRGSRTASLGIAAVASAIALVAIPAGSAFATPPTPVTGTATGTADLSAGSLLFVPPSTVGFTKTLDGTDQTANDSQALDVMDGSGSADGWNITLSSTPFALPGDGPTLPNDATTDVGTDGGTCDTAAPDCQLGDNDATGYPITVPADADAVIIQAAALGSGMGDQTWVHGMELAIPATTLAGNYSSTWTYSLVSGPGTL